MPEPDPGEATLFLGPGAGERPAVPFATEPSTASVDEELPRGAFVDRYVVLGVAGRGGMGVVYAAYDPELDRKVALKLVRPNRPGIGPGTLLREAQTIARLSHPNVVAVYDVGLVGGPGSEGDRVFLAMELVEGRNLRQWLAEAERTPREIVSAFVEAGRGLAAAHAAGVVHRDFKPENVLIGAEGRARVADFGVAWREEPALPRGEGLADLAHLVDRGERAARAEAPGSLRTRAVAAEAPRAAAVGTVPYMSPEQLAGGAADARSDQFGFCVALYEALFGVRPFAGKDPVELALAIDSGVLAEPAVGPRRLPARLRHVRQVLARGLAGDRAARFPTMAALLAALADDPRARVRRRLAIAGGLGIAALGAFGLRELALSRARVCSGGEEQVAQVWNGAAREATRRAFLATGLPFAAASADGVSRALDAYARAWASGHREACAATRLRGEQSEALLDRRMFCLDQRLRDLAAFVDVLGRPDAQLVERAVAAASDLPPLASCSDLATLTARVPPPADPKARAAVTAIGRSLAAARALAAAGRYAQGIAPARRASAGAERISYLPIRAETLVTLGDLLERTDDFGPARDALSAAWTTAEAAADDEVKVRAATALMRLERIESRYDRAREWGGLGAAALARLGRETSLGSLRARHLQETGLLASAEGAYDQALGPLREAVALRRGVRSGGADVESGAALAESLGSLGVVLHRTGAYDEAREAYEEALELDLRDLGPDHPEVAAMLQRLGNLHADQGRFAEAAELGRRALAIREKVFGPNHHQVAASLTSLGNAENELGRPAAALALYERALAIQRGAFGPDSPLVAVTLLNKSNAQSRSGQLGAAEASLREVYRIRVRAFGDEHPSVALVLHNLGTLEAKRGRPAAALTSFRRALAISERALGPEHPNVVEGLLSIADAEQAAGRPLAALPALERALAVVEKTAPGDELTGRVRFALAQALTAAGRDRPRAWELARAAEGNFAALGADGRNLGSEVARWLGAQRQPL